MSVLPSDDRSVTIGNTMGPSGSASVRKDRLVGTTFAILAGVAMAGWLYLIAKMVWASISWLLF